MENYFKNLGEGFKGLLNGVPFGIVAGIVISAPFYFGWLSDEYIFLYLLSLLAILFLTGIAYYTKESNSSTTIKKEQIQREASVIVFEFNSVDKAILFQNEIISNQTGWKYIQIDKNNDENCLFVRENKYYGIGDIALSKYQIINYSSIVE